MCGIKRIEANSTSLSFAVHLPILPKRNNRYISHIRYINSIFVKRGVNRAHFFHPGFPLIENPRYIGCKRTVM
jgi:hypothetical protein